MTIEIREQIRLCKKFKLDDRLLFIKNNLEPYRYEINSPNSDIKRENLIILLADLYYEIGDIQKLNRIMLRV